MELKQKGPNVLEVVCAGARILYSYGEPVAIHQATYSYCDANADDAPKQQTERWIRTDRYVSRTTERHIADFIDGAPVVRVAHEVIQRLARDADV